MINKAIVEKFLEGEGALSELKYIRSIETAYWSNKAYVFTRRPNEEKAARLEYKFKPFLFSKKLDFNVYFKHRYIEINPEEIVDNSFIYENKKYDIDNVNVKFVTKNIWTDYDIYRILIEDIEERKKFFKERCNLYNIKIKKLKIDETIPRLASGFKYLISIEESDKHLYSDNPLLKYKKSGKLKIIRGSYSDLLNFFREGGVDVYRQTGVYFNNEKFKTFWKNLNDKQRLLFYFQTQDLFKKTKPGLDIESLFANEIKKNELLKIIKKNELVKHITDYYNSFNNDKLYVTDSNFLETEEYCVLNADKIGNKIKGKKNELYLSPILDKVKHLTNGFVFLEGIIKVGTDWKKIKPYIKQYFKTLKQEIVHYSTLCLDQKEYEKIFHKFYPDFKQLLINELSNIEKSKDTRPTSKLSQAQVYNYIDLIGLNEFLSFVDDKKIKIYLNDLFIPELNKNQKKDTFSFHNTITGRKFIDLCEEYQYDILDHIDPMFMAISPTSQFMIQSGARLFKGLDYDDLNILCFDIETRAQKGYEYDNRAALDPNMGEIFYIGIKNTKGYETVLHADNSKEEKEIIEETYRIINELNPDFIIGYNSEHFDFPYLEKRLEILGGVKDDKNGDPCVFEYIRSLIPQEFDGDSVFPYYLYNKRENSHLKVGGGTEKYTQTNIYGTNIFDGIHQTKRLQAIDKRDSLSLKWNVKKEKIAKANRVYVPGDKIGQIGKDNRQYYLNESNGDWFVNEIDIIPEENFFEKRKIKPDEEGNIFYENKNNLYINSKGDDYLDQKCINVITLEDYNSVNEFKEEIFKQIKNFDQLIIPKKRFGVLYKDENPILYKEIIAFLYDLQKAFKDLKNVYQHINFDDYIQVNGKEIIKRYLLDDLWETLELFRKMGQSPFLLSSWIPTSAQKIFTMGNASMWKLLMMTWFYRKGLGIPDYEDYRKINGGLIGMFKSGYCRGVVKYDASSLYPSAKLEYLPAPSWDITKIGDGFLFFFLDTRLTYKALTKKYFKEGDLINGQLYDILQHPLKIFINSYYGFLAAWNISPFSDMISAHGITAISRSVARHLISWFEGNKFEAIYSHTDGINFIYPENVEDYKYVGKGLNWLVKKDVEYIGLDAYVAEYNDLFMRGKMGIDIDGIDHSCINIAKSNVVHFKVINKEKNEYHIDIVGGLIKKDTSNYIKTFLDDNLESLMLGNSNAFIKAYFEYVNKILNRKIKGIDIASKVKFKSLNEYAHYKTKQAPYEAIIKYNVDIDPGTVFYYYNSGDEDRDSGTDKIPIGRLIVNDIPDEKIKNIISMLKKFDDRKKIKDIINWFIENDKFEWKRNRISGKLTNKQSNENLESINQWDGLDFKVNEKQNKRTKEIKKYIEVIMVKEILNVKPLALHDHHSLVDYNPQKYLKAFHNAVEPLLLCFPPDLRKKMVGDTMPVLSSYDIELINGIPLEGKEHNQQDKNEIMQIEDIEMEFWKDSGLDPHWFLNNKKYDEDFYVIKDNDEYIMEVNKYGKIWHESKKDFPKLALVA